MTDVLGDVYSAKYNEFRKTAKIFADWRVKETLLRLRIKPDLPGRREYFSPFGNSSTCYEFDILEKKGKKLHSKNGVFILRFRP